VGDPLKTHLSEAIKLTRQHKYGLAAKAWKDARSSFSDPEEEKEGWHMKKRAQCVRLQVKCEMRYTVKLLEANR